MEACRVGVQSFVQATESECCTGTGGIAPGQCILSRHPAAGALTPRPLNRRAAVVLPSGYLFHSSQYSCLTHWSAGTDGWYFGSPGNGGSWSQTPIQPRQPQSFPQRISHLQEKLEDQHSRLAHPAKFVLKGLKIQHQ